MHKLRKGYIMLKFAKTAKVGDTIRAYDFAPCAGRDDAFIEGIVQEVDSMESGFLSYKIEVTAEKWIKFETKPSKKNRVGKTMFVPYQTSFMEFDFRVINLSKG
jgi:hypothetical protein